jgi:hypothetical protein
LLRLVHVSLEQCRRAEVRECERGNTGRAQLLRQRETLGREAARVGKVAASPRDPAQVSESARLAGAVAEPATDLEDGAEMLRRLAYGACILRNVASAGHHVGASSLERRIGRAAHREDSLEPCVPRREEAAHEPVPPERRA